MAVEARHLSLFSPQIFTNRDMGNFAEGNGIMYGGPVRNGVVGGGPVSGTTTAETLIPMYGSALADSFPVKTPMKSDSGLTCAITATRKRPREDDAAAINRIHQSLFSFPPNVQSHHRQQQSNSNNHRGGASFTFLGHDISLQIQQQQLEIDRFVAQHTEKVRMEIEERRKRYSRRVVAAVEESIMNKLRAKEEEIDKIGKLNWALEERVKSLCVENQIWRDLAQTNEATANALRSNLEQVLAAQVYDVDRHRNGGEDAVDDDAQSCCGSNYNIIADIDDVVNANHNSEEDEERKLKSRLCRSCEKEESSVLVLPCRHLCLCSTCSSSLHICPVCKSTKNATLHINLSSSISP